MRYRWRDRRADLERPSSPWPYRIEAALIGFLMALAAGTFIYERLR